MTAKTDHSCDPRPLQVPADMVIVSRDEFFAYVNPRDIVLSNHDPNHTTWETRSRVVVGRTYPGWKNPGGERTYLLTKRARGEE